MLTVLVATRNGASTLTMTLAAMQDLKIDSPWELIVVDNASTDKSCQIIKSFRKKLPLRMVAESRLGKNAALNTGLKYASGDFIVLTDDDVLPHSDWLSQLETCSADHPDFDIFGGRILPYWISNPDPIILDNAPFDSTYAITPKSVCDGPVSPGMVWGGNMAVRRRVFDASHRFNENVGPCGENYLMGSETEFTTRVYEQGFRSWFCNAALVKHIIRENQLDREWVLSRAYRNGRGWWHQQPKRGFTVPCIAGLPRCRFRVLAGEYGRLLLATLRRDSVAGFRAHWQIRFLKGYLTEGWRSRNANTNRE